MGKKVFLRYGGKQEFTSKGVTYSENIYDRSIIYDLGKKRMFVNYKQEQLDC